jgi:predicted GIY-YIG superfamily endonuclease
VDDARGLIEPLARMSSSPAAGEAVQRLTRLTAPTVYTMASRPVYTMASRRNGTLYAGVTADLARRAHEHRTGLLPGFTRRYRCDLLVSAERHKTVRDAIACELSLILHTAASAPRRRMGVHKFLKNLKPITPITWSPREEHLSRSHFRIAV